LVIERKGYVMVSETIKVTNENDVKSHTLKKAASTTVESQALAQVSFYPNPAAEYVVLENVEGIRFVELYNALGHLVLHQDLRGERKLRLSVQALPEGVAYLLLSDGQAVKTLCVLVQR